jgi:NAD+ kinase
MSQKLAFIASLAPDAQDAKARLVALYGEVPETEADVIVALGGDGLMLQVLHKFMWAAKPIYGMNKGSVGFLMNDYAEENLLERLEQAESSLIHPLLMKAHDQHGMCHTARAINEVSLLRSSSQAAKIRIIIDEKPRLEELVCDGVLLATPAGSTAYNLSAHGPIVPLNSPLLALTPISPFRPRRWRGALIPDSGHVRFEIIEHDKRPVNAVADHFEVKNIAHVDISLDRAISMTMMHDPNHSLDERILREQFQL